jgi:YidC/Oxa1 family membrane protein insertase
MDFIRTLLIGVIAVLSFMLLTEWVQFKQQQTPPPMAASQEQSYPEELDLPAPGDVAATGSDVPQAPTAAGTDPAEVQSHGDSIILSTDVLRLKIDLTGGDIVEAALPAYPARINAPDVPFLLLENNERRTYVAQSGLVGSNGIDNSGRPLFTSTKKLYTLADDSDTLVVDLQLPPRDGVYITKRFTAERGEYVITVEYLVDNRSDSRWQANMFGQIKRDSSKDPSADNSSGMGMVPFLGSATTTADERFKKFNFEEMREDPFKDKIQGGWIAMIQHYFLSAWIPDPDMTHTYTTRVTKNGYNIAGFISPAVAVDPGHTESISARFYAGPKDQHRLAEISQYLDLSVDYGWLWWIAQPLFWLLVHIYDFVGNWGVAIILLTVFIKGVFFKLSATSYRSMANMRRVQPKLVAIKERYGDDKQKQSQAMMDLYKKEKINPLSGCLPILVQMPVFIALYWTLMESVELRQAPFFGWIEDLAVMDPYFILPLIMGASMWFQQKLSPPMADPMQAKIMQWMPVIFTFFFLWFPAGLVLYWVSNNVLSIAQQWFITRQIEKAAAHS